MTHVSAAERRIMEHALGRTAEAVTERRRHKRPDWRNAYVCGPDSDAWEPIQRLINIGFMELRIGPDSFRGGMSVFSVTEKGREWLTWPNGPPTKRDLGIR